MEGSTLIASVVEVNVFEGSGLNERLDDSYLRNLIPAVESNFRVFGPFPYTRFKSSANEFFQQQKSIKIFLQYQPKVSKALIQ